MPRKVISLAAGSILTALLVGCTLSSPDKLAGNSTLSGDTKVILLQTTDVHDHANGYGAMSATSPGPVGSYARVASYVNSVRAGAPANSSVILVDSGDWTMGTLYDLTIGEQPLATFFVDTLRYDCVTLGNHEFDYTPKGLATMLSLSQSKFGYHTPIVASNTNIHGNADLAPFMGTAILPSYTRTYPSGLKVGFIGLMGTDAGASAPAAAPVTFTDYSKDYSIVQNLVDDLRNVQGCHVVVALSHAGTDSSKFPAVTGEDVQLASHVKNIDVIASGHTHNPFPNASASFEVANGTWKTRIISAGAFSTNVSRIDLTYHFAAKNTTVDAASNMGMTDANLGAIPGCTVRDPAQSVFVGQADASLNAGLASLFTTLFNGLPGYVYNPADLTTGVYKTVGVAAQDMVSNDQNPVRCPNGLGDFCADSVRSVPNGILSKAVAGYMAAAHVDQATAVAALTGMGYDLTPYTAGIVPSGVIRDGLTAGPISFANAYNVLPLGISPDTTQAIPVGYPLMSVYATYEDLQKICALQLLSQCNLTPSDYYLNLSGLGYALDGPGSYTYFKYAAAAGILQITQGKAASSANAAAALQALLAASQDPTAAALMAAVTAGNPYAAAMVALNDDPAGLTPTLIHANLVVLGEVANLGGTDAATGSISLNTRMFNVAIGAIGTVSAYAATDPACVGATTPLVAGTRYRVAGDLYAIVMMGAARSKFGVDITAYAAATGSTTVSGANLAGAMANRISAAAPGAAVVELKEWMALMQYLGASGGSISSAYASTANFLDFAVPGRWGAAVMTRSATYPLAQIGPLMQTLGTLTAAP